MHSSYYVFKFLFFFHFSSSFLHEFGMVVRKLRCWDTQKWWMGEIFRLYGVCIHALCIRFWNEIQPVIWPPLLFICLSTCRICNALVWRIQSHRDPNIDWFVLLTDKRFDVAQSARLKKEMQICMHTAWRGEWKCLCKSMNVWAIVCVMSKCLRRVRKTT